MPIFVALDSHYEEEKINGAKLYRTCSESGTELLG